MHYRTYLPLIDFATDPDLIVERIAVAGGVVQVTVKNIGSAPVTSAFWVDVYINPSTAPTHVNQVWPMIAKQGLVWGVTEAALPLAPGASLTLTVGDQFYVPALSKLSSPLSSGTRIYAQADSANATTDYGAVLETHERAGGPYNNISSTTVGQAIQPALLLPASLPAPTSAALPARPEGMQP